MSFFKDFKDDLSQAVNELMPGEGSEEPKELDDDMVVNTLESDLDVETELSKLDGLLEKVSRDVNEPKTPEVKPETMNKIEAVPVMQNAQKPNLEKKTSARSAEESKQPEKSMKKEETPEKSVANKTLESPKRVEEDKKMSELNNDLEQVNTMDDAALTISVADGEISDEVSVITEGTHIKGNMESAGSLDIRGAIEGNVTCNGKLVVTGTINGNSASSEFFADAAKIEGEVTSTGTVKVGLGSVIIGNISATSAVIAGAIKGDIDVQGPVVVDTSAVIMGNIKSRSVQINNGAVIEGFCSQSYAEVDVASLFGNKGN